MNLRQKEKRTQPASKSSLWKKSNDNITQTAEKSKSEEKWVDIDGCRHHYQISNLGRIRRLHYLSPSEDKNGYSHICLSGKYHYIHRLVATYFLNKKNPKDEVNHIDGNPRNNVVTNLEWCSHRENIQHSYNCLGRQHVGLKGFDSVCSKPVGQFDLDDNLIKVWGSLMEIERETGINHGNISLACSGKRKNNKSHGYIWKWLS